MREKIIKLLIYIFICCAILALAISLDQDNIAINIIKDISILHLRQVPTQSIPIEKPPLDNKQLSLQEIWRVPELTLSFNSTMERKQKRDKILDTTLDKLQTTKDIIYGKKDNLAFAPGPKVKPEAKEIPMSGEDFVNMYNMLSEYKLLLFRTSKMDEDCRINIIKLTEKEVLLERKVSQQGAIIDHNNNIYRLLSILICSMTLIFAIIMLTNKGGKVSVNCGSVGVAVDCNKKDK